MGAHRVGGEAPIDQIRGFFGLPLPDEHRRVLAAYLESCGAGAPDFRWTDPANLHLTVRFVGSVERSVVDGVASRIAGRAFGLALADRVGTFRSGRLARVVWMGVSDGAESLSALAATVEAECVAAGLEPEGRAFRPHLTLARARPREGAQLPELPAPPRLDPWRASELVLYSSHLGRGGAVHEPIRVVRLAD